MVKVAISKFQDGLGEYVKELNDYPILTREEEIVLFKKLKKGSLEARDRLIKCNLKLVVAIVLRSFTYYNISLMDLISEGNLALIHAIDNYKLELNAKFSSYAYKVIYDRIKRYLQKNLGDVRIAYNKQDKMTKYRKLKETFFKEYGYNPTFDDMANILGVSKKEIETLEHLMTISPFSYDAFTPNNNDDELNHEDRLLNYKDTRSNPELCFLRENDAIFTSELIDAFILTDLQKEALKKRFIENKSYDQIGLELNARNYKSASFLVYEALEKIRTLPYNRLILARYVYGLEDTLWITEKLSSNKKNHTYKETIYQILNLPKEIVDEAIRIVIDTDKKVEVFNYRFLEYRDRNFSDTDIETVKSKLKSYYYLQGRIKKEALRLLEKRENKNNKTI